MPSFIPCRLKKPPSSASARSPDLPSQAPRLTHTVLDLQRTMGNQAVESLLQTNADASRSPAAGEETLVQAPDDLSEILPKKQGPLGRVITVVKLYDIFGPELLKEHARLVRADPAARKFAQTHGVPGIVALYDTRRDNAIDVPEAGQALTEHAERYTRESLDALKLALRQEAPRTYWFEDPAMQQLPAQGADELPRSSAEERQKVFTEAGLSSARAGSSLVWVRFSYPEPDLPKPKAERRKGEVPKVASAKDQILKAIQNVMKQLLEVSDTGPEQAKTSARLMEAWSGFGPKSPLKVYIATDPKEEFTTSQVAATTDRIFVRLEDVGNPKKLEAAIRVPLIVLRGGMLPGAGEVPPITSEELQETMLHEALHGMLARESLDAEAMWEEHQGDLRVRGNPTAKASFLELARKYLLAQDEVFAFQNVGASIPASAKSKVLYDFLFFVREVGGFLTSRGIGLIPITHNIPVKQRVHGKSVPWSISHLIPSGEIELTVGDIRMVDKLLRSFPTR